MSALLLTNLRSDIALRFSNWKPGSGHSSWNTMGAAHALFLVFLFDGQESKTNKMKCSNSIGFVVILMKTMLKTRYNYKQWHRISATDAYYIFRDWHLMPHLWRLKNRTKSYFKLPTVEMISFTRLQTLWLHQVRQVILYITEHVLTCHPIICISL